MRNTSGPARGSWATYVKSARERQALSIAELARRVAVDRGTVHRWESGRNKPDDVEVVAGVARVLKLDVEEALAAAGLRPGVGAPAQPTVEVDEEVQLILNSNLSDRRKTEMIARLHELREQDRQRREQTIRWMIEGNRGA